MSLFKDKHYNSTKIFICRRREKREHLYEMISFYIILKDILTMPTRKAFMKKWDNKYLFFKHKSFTYIQSISYNTRNKLFTLVFKFTIVNYILWNKLFIIFFGFVLLSIQIKLIYNVIKFLQKYIVFISNCICNFGPKTRFRYNTL